MIFVKNLKRLLEDYPDEAVVCAYEGEGTGLRVTLGEQFGWIETGDSDSEGDLRVARRVD